MHTHFCISAIAVGAVLFSAMAVAQAKPAEPNASRQGDAFVSVHASLNDAADRALAAALAERSCMHPPDSERIGENASLDIDTHAPRMRIRAAVNRVNQLRPIIEPILQDAGVPLDLSAVVLVESGGLVTALSPKGARGVWQLMPQTARRYGLAVSDGRDERLDVEKSTRAAALYFRDLYQQFRDWELAFAAYNAGEHTVGRAVAGTGQRDFTSIRGALPSETRNYVAAVMQAMQRLHNSDFGNKTRVIFAISGAK